MRPLRKRSLRYLLSIHEGAFLLLVTLTGLVSGLSTYYWQQTSSESVRVNNLVYLAEQIRAELFRQIHEVIRARILEEANALNLYSTYSRRIDTHFNQLRQNAASRAEDDAIQALQQSYREIQRDMNRIFADPYGYEYAVRMNILDPRIAQAMIEHFEQRYDTLKQLLSGRLQQLDKTMSRWTALAPGIVPASVLVAVLLVLLARHILRIGVVRPLATVKAGAAEISRGNLRYRVPVDGVSEVSEIADSINRMAHDLAASRDALVENERQAALGALVPVVAHNIRNPLASIRATAQVLDKTDSPEELADSRQAIINTIDRLGRWVNSLVSYLHPMKPNRRPVAAVDLRNGVIEVLSAKLDEKHIDLRCGGWDAETMLDLDPDLMEQVLTLLLANAIEASPAGTAIECNLLRADAGVEIRIRDQGPGLPFQPQPGRLEPGPSTKKIGTGLGIPIAYKICQAHGFDLEFRPVRPHGTEVRILIRERQTPVADHA